VCERLEASAALLEREPAALHPVIAEILRGAQRFGALDVHQAYTRLARLRRECHALLDRAELLLVPSTSIFPRIADVLAEPLAINSELGRYTNFVNLLDLCALAVPAGMRSDGLPFGVTLIAHGGWDALLASVGRALHERLARTLGATGAPLMAAEASGAELKPSPGCALLAVCGAHLSGQALNGELTALGARLRLATHTAPAYRLFALPTTPPKPGLVRAGAGESGYRIEVEVWELAHAAFGEFVARIPGPLGVGAIELESGAQVQGFLCEAVAISGAPEISRFGGWRAYRAQT
jgi:allophanate hydrolase